MKAAVQPVMDVVFLSRASSAPLRDMTQRAIDTCVEFAEQPITVTVMEQNHRITYSHAVTVEAPVKFAYNAFANAAAALGTAPWIMVANNDLVFTPGWLAPLLAAGHPLVSPQCPEEKRQAGITANTVGPQIGVHFSGWCFAITRDLWERIGGFDEDFTFWCADDAVIQQVLAQGVNPMLVPASQVVHLGSVTHRSEPDLRGDRTWAQVWKFEEKYGVPKFQHSRAYARWKYQFRPKARLGVQKRVRF